jgi:hypothetical protein
MNWQSRCDSADKLTQMQTNRLMHWSGVHLRINAILTADSHVVFDDGCLFYGCASVWTAFPDSRKYFSITVKASKNRILTIKPREEKQCLELLRCANRLEGFERQSGRYLRF